MSFGYRILGFGIIVKAVIQGAAMIIRIIYKGLVKDTWTSPPTAKEFGLEDWFQVDDAGTIKDRKVDKYVWVAEDELDVRLKN